MSLPHIPLLTAVLASGCTGQETGSSGREAAEVLAYADSIAENVMQGFNEGN